MLEGLQTEIDRYPELVGASNEIKMRAINSATAETELWVVRDDELKVPVGDMLALLSLDSQARLYDFMQTDTNEAKGFKLFYEKHDQFKVADPVFRGTIQLLHDPLNVLTVDERDIILRLGERLQTRAEELFGRLITAEDFE